jgi:hypothetical protein
MHKIMSKKFYLSPKFGTLFNKSWITNSELLHAPSDVPFEQPARRFAGAA